MTVSLNIAIYNEIGIYVQVTAQETYKFKQVFVNVTLYGLDLKCNIKFFYS